MGFEIDYIPVGDGEKGGDAIALRYGNLSGAREEYNVVIIDGGTKESGRMLVEHVKKYYNTDFVDTVVCTHLHNDHASGLTEVLENLKVGKLLMHLPWEHAVDIKNFFSNNSLTLSGLSEKAQKSLSIIKELQDLADEKNITIIEPFAGLSIHNDGSLIVLGPTIEYYQQLLANCDFMPKLKSHFTIPESFSSFGKSVINWVSETWDHATETLDDSGETSHENNTSTVILFQTDNKKFLFTGDAGIPAIQKAAQFAEENGISLANIDFLDVPHHGSRRNIGKTLLNYLKPAVAFISAPKAGDPKHPSRKVVNALRRRGAKVVSTKGECKCHSFNAPARPGWSEAVEEDLYPTVEE